MELEMFVVNLAVTIGVVALAMLYLRRTTRQVIRELCHTDVAAEFWLRSTDVMAYSGSLVLVLLFADGNVNWVEGVREVLTLTLCGLFLTVMFASSNVWKSLKVNPEPNAQPQKRGSWT